MAIKNKEVLILDDDKDVRFFVRNVLEHAGMKVTEAESVEEAFRNSYANAPHLLIVDLNIPSEDGFSFLEKRQSIPKLRQIPAMVLSGYKDRNSIFKAISLGACDYLMKPTNATLLLQKVRKSLSDFEFLSYVFETDSRPTIKANFKANILRASEASLLLEAPVKIAGQTPIKISSDLIVELGLSKCVFHTSLKAGEGRPAGQYLNRVNAVGLTADEQAVIRSKLVHLK